MNKRKQKNKRTSISRQLTVTFLSIIGIIMLLMFLANTFLLEKFYERRLENTLVSMFEMADGHVTADGLNQTFFNKTFLETTQKNSVIAAITDADYVPVLVYGTGNDSLEILSARLNGYIWGIDQGSQVVKKENNYTIQKKKDDHLGNVVYLELYGTFTKNGYHILLRVPVESIRTSVKISNEFVMYMILLAIVLSVIMIGWMSKRLTKPLTELTELSERMANLDFNARYTSGGTNEIGRLGEHFNQMSQTLEKTISELKTANNELQANLDAKIKAEDERREFLSNVSHELKTPLALIQGYAEGLQDCVNDDPESRDYYCSVIIDEAGKMNQLVRKLMALNQLESGYDKVEMTRFDLAELIRGKTASTKILADQKGASIEVQCPSCVHVWGDEFKVEEVLTNYLSNAINHVEGALRIQIRVEEDSERGVVRTTVFNTGKPIPEEDLEHVWDKFFKVDKARTRAYGGSGVGLAIVKAIMESFHQRYGVRNVEDGVEFWFELEDGDGELVDEEMEDEKNLLTRQNRENGGQVRTPIFRRTEGSREEDLEYRRQQQRQQEAAARKEEARREREEENRAVDAVWVPVGKKAGRKEDSKDQQMAESRQEEKERMEDGISKDEAGSKKPENGGAEIRERECRKPGDSSSESSS